MTNILVTIFKLENNSKKDHGNYKYGFMAYCSSSFKEILTPRSSKTVIGVQDS